VFAIAIWAGRRFVLVFVIPSAIVATHGAGHCAGGDNGGRGRSSLLRRVFALEVRVL
jgi:hypothetical protein